MSSQPDEYGMTPLMYAVKNATTELFEEEVVRLLELGVNLEQKNKHGYTALLYSVLPTNYYNGYFKESTVNTVKLLLDAGADVNTKTLQKETPLSFVVGFYTGGNNRLNKLKLKLLLDAGADTEARDTYGHTPLSVFLGRTKKYGTEVMVRILLEAGADANAVDGFGGPALSYAAVCDGTSTVKMLLEAGVDPLSIFIALKATVRNIGRYSDTLVITQLIESIY